MALRELAARAEDGAAVDVVFAVGAEAPYAPAGRLLLLLLLLLEEDPQPASVAATTATASEAKLRAVLRFGMVIIVCPFIGLLLVRRRW